jgi:hypothetical protein
MRCDRVQKLYSEYAVSSLSPGRLDDIDVHLASCAECRGFYDKQELIGRLITDSSDIPHPGSSYFENLHQNVIHQLESGAGQQTFPPPHGIWGSNGVFGLFRPLWLAGCSVAAALFFISTLPELPVPNNFTPEGLTGQPTGLMLSETTTPAATEINSPRDQNRAVQVLSMDPNPLTLIPGSTLDRTDVDSLDKSIGGIVRGQSDTERILASTNRNMGIGDESITPIDQQAVHETESRVIELEQGAGGRNIIPQEIIEEIQILKAQLLDGGDASLEQRMSGLEEDMESQISDSDSLLALPAMQQMSLYRKAHASLLSGDLPNAQVKYLRIINLKDTSPLSHRASLQLADIAYSEWADFRKAREYYEVCHDAADSIAFTSLELDHIRRQLDMLDMYSLNNWEALRMVNIISRESWDRAEVAFQLLLSIENADRLLPDAARKVIHRLNNEPLSKPDAEITQSLYNLLANRIKQEQNREIQAWLEITVAEIILVHSEDYGQAIDHYRRAASLSEGSSAASFARSRLGKLADLRLQNQIR